MEFQGVVVTFKEVSLVFEISGVPGVVSGSLRELQVV